MRLESVTVTGFQSYRDEVTIAFDGRLTVLAGRNNVGKSALLRALRLPLDASSGCREDFRLTYRWVIAADVFAAAVQVALQPNVPPELHFVATFERTKPPETERGEIHPIELRCAEVGVPELGISARNGKWATGPLMSGHESPVALTDLATRLCRSVAHLAHRRITPGRRGTTAQSYLMPDGNNLTEVMIHLRNNRPSVHNELVNFMNRAFPEIETITATAGVTDADRGQTELHVFYEGTGDSPVPLTDCGTGIEQMLAVGTAIFTTEQPHVFLIDEPQLHLHPHAERSLQQLLAEHDHHQYIIATHSPTFLRVQPLARTRLITMTHGRSQVLDTATEPGAVLEGLGLTGADLWLAERIIWVEGASDVEIVEKVLASSDVPSGDVVRALPLHTRFSSAGPRTAQQTFDFCREIARAISPLPVSMLFLFDGDEKSATVKRKIVAASGGRAKFLPCREIENLLLDPTCIATLISRRRIELGLSECAPGEVEAHLESILGQTDDRELYPAGSPRSEAQRMIRISGSVALGRLYWTFLKADYGKVRDGPALAELVLAKEPKRLLPLISLLSDSDVLNMIGVD